MSNVSIMHQVQVALLVSAVGIATLSCTSESAGPFMQEQIGRVDCSVDWRFGKNVMNFIEEQSTSYGPDTIVVLVDTSSDTGMFQVYIWDIVLGNVRCKYYEILGDYSPESSQHSSQLLADGLSSNPQIIRHYRAVLSVAAAESDPRSSIVRGVPREDQLVNLDTFVFIGSQLLLLPPSPVWNEYYADKFERLAVNIDPYRPPSDDELSEMIAEDFVFAGKADNPYDSLEELHRAYVDRLLGRSKSNIATELNRLFPMLILNSPSNW